jgi:hypothetical protein
MRRSKVGALEIDLSFACAQVEDSIIAAPARDVPDNDDSQSPFVGHQHEAVATPLASAKHPVITLGR